MNGARAGRALPKPRRPAEYVSPILDADGVVLAHGPVPLGRGEPGDAIGIDLARLMDGRLLSQGSEDGLGPVADRESRPRAVRSVRGRPLDGGRAVLSPTLDALLGDLIAMRRFGLHPDDRLVGRLLAPQLPRLIAATRADLKRGPQDRRIAR